jgi:hypothetical protein
VGGQVAQGLLATLDRVVLLDRLVTLFLGGNTVRISIRVAAPLGANVRTVSKAFVSPRDSVNPLRSPPARQVPDFGERLEHQLPRGTDDAGNHDLATRPMLDRLRAVDVEKAIGDRVGRLTPAEMLEANPLLRVVLDIL